MSGTLLGATGACVLATLSTQVTTSPLGVVEHLQAEIVDTGGCEQILLLAPPGVDWLWHTGKVKPGDGGHHDLEPLRWHVGPRGLDGWQTTTLVVPELLRGDAVHIQAQRTWSPGTPYRWRPGLDGARFAELSWKTPPPDLAWQGVQTERRGLWVHKPDATAGAWQPGPTDPDPSGPVSELTPAEAVATISRWVLLPERRDLLPVDPTAIGAATPSQIARTLVQQTRGGPTPLQLAAGPDGQSVAVALIDGQARIWAHPDTAWPEGVTTVHLKDQEVAVLAPPSGAGPSLAAPARLTRSLRPALPEGVGPDMGLVPGRGAATLSVETWTLDAAPVARAHNVAPAGATLLSHRLIEGRNSTVLVPPTDDQALLLAAPGEAAAFELIWSTPDIDLCGTIVAPDHTTLESFDVKGPGLEVAIEGDTWRIVSWDGLKLLDERARVVAALNARFNRRALPEPGLPLRLRSRLSGWDLVAEMSGALRERARVADLGGDPLWPRRLHAARASGVVSPIEAALIVRGYALQSKITAHWALVRPADRGPGHPLCFDGHDQALVRVELDDEVRWLDPGCTQCAPFEVRPELLGAAALGPWIDRTPEPPEGSLDVRIDGLDVTWVLTGPAALQLRLWLEGIPKGERADAMAERLAGPGATFVDASGVADLGADITVHARAASAASLPEGLHSIDEPGR